MVTVVENGRVTQSSNLRRGRLYLGKGINQIIFHRAIGK